MVLLACVCFVAMWEALSATVEKHFAHDYAEGMIKRAQNSGLQGAALQARVDEANNFEVACASPLYRMSMTLLEPLPVGLIMALVTAGILRRKSNAVALPATSARMKDCTAKDACVDSEAWRFW